MPCWWVTGQKHQICHSRLLFFLCRPAFSRSVAKLVPDSNGGNFKWWLTVGPDGRQTPLLGQPCFLVSRSVDTCTYQGVKECVSQSAVGPGLRQRPQATSPRSHGLSGACITVSGQKESKGETKTPTRSGAPLPPKTQRATEVVASGLTVRKSWRIYRIVTFFGAHHRAKVTGQPKLNSSVAGLVRPSQETWDTCELLCFLQSLGKRGSSHKQPKLQQTLEGRVWADPTF